MEKKALRAMKETGEPIRFGDIVKLIEADCQEVSGVIAQLKKKGKVVSP